jgi:hypothetical protein
MSNTIDIPACVLKAFAAFASEDTSRPHLNAVWVDRELGLVATDGHALATINWDAFNMRACPFGTADEFGADRKVPVAWALDSLKEVCRLAKARGRVVLGKDCTAVAMARGKRVRDIATILGGGDPTLSYPPVDQVIPDMAQCHGVAVAFDPKLLARATALGAAMNAAIGSVNYEVRMQLWPVGSELAPLRIEYASRRGTLGWDYDSDSDQAELPGRTLATVVVMPMRL